MVLVLKVGFPPEMEDKGHKVGVYVLKRIYNLCLTGISLQCCFKGILSTSLKV